VIVPRLPKFRLMESPSRSHTRLYMYQYESLSYFEEEKDRTTVKKLIYNGVHPVPASGINKSQR
jgi:hypothetical protein